MCIGRFVWIRDFISCNVKEEVATYAFSELPKELTKLNKKDTPFFWTIFAQ
jgi:hypothetical protein